MAISFVAQAENSFGSDTSPLATTSTLTLAAGDLVEVIVAGTTSATIVVSDGTNSYVAQGGTLASISPFQMYAFVAQNCAAGAVTVTPQPQVSVVRMEFTLDRSAEQPRLARLLELQVIIKIARQPLQTVLFLTILQ